MTDDVLSFDVDGEAKASPDALKRLREAIATAISLNEHIEQMASDLKAAEITAREMREKHIPEIMAEIQSDHFSHAVWDIKLTDFVHGGLPKDEAKKKIGIDWLKKNNGGGLIKSVLGVQFGISKHADAVRLAKRLIKEGHPATLVSAVNAGSLKKYARERMKDGAPIDFEALGLYVGKEAKFKLIKGDDE